MPRNTRNADAALSRADDISVVLHTEAAAPSAAGTVVAAGEELLTRRPVTGTEAAVIVAFLVVAAALLIIGKPIAVILGLLAGVGAITVIVLARRIPKFSVSE